MARRTSGFSRCTASSGPTDTSYERLSGSRWVACSIPSKVCRQRSERRGITDARIGKSYGKREGGDNKYSTVSGVGETQNHSPVLCLDRSGVARQLSIATRDKHSSLIISQNPMPLAEESGEYEAVAAGQRCR